MDKQKKTKWPIVLTIVIASFMIVLLSWVVYSFTQNVELVEHDYYQKEVVYEQQIERIRRTIQLKEQPTFRFDKNRDVLILSFPTQFQPGGVKGEITFFRPSDSRLDWTVPVRLDGNHNQSFSGGNFQNGYWKIKMSWAYNQLEYYHEESLTIARAR
ncbi:MAG: hypothetical protein DWQ05_14965 [Calditrichaeota bacterium]|nr:MAG: hypothetical protein DWQ05_14965 [Calditrichota bacterium]